MMTHPPQPVQIPILRSARAMVAVLPYSRALLSISTSRGQP